MAAKENQVSPNQIPPNLPEIEPLPVKPKGRRPISDARGPSRDQLQLGERELELHLDPKRSARADLLPSPTVLQPTSTSSTSALFFRQARWPDPEPTNGDPTQAITFCATPPPRGIPRRWRSSFTRQRRCFLRRGSFWQQHFKSCDKPRCGQSSPFRFKAVSASLLQRWAAGAIFILGSGGIFRAAMDNSKFIPLSSERRWAHIYSTSHIQTNSKLPKNINICSAFLANIDEHKSVDVNIFGEVYTLPPWSVSILPDCKSVAFNTAKVGAQVSLKLWEIGSSSNSSKTGLLSKQIKEIHMSKNWMYFKEPVGAWGDNAFTSQGILEHLNVTKDATDYLWYITRINVTVEDVSFWTETGVLPSLIIDSMRDVVRVFVNGHFAGSAHGKWIKVSQPVYLVQGSNELALVSETVGLQNYGAFLEKDGAGFRGKVKLIGMKAGEIDLSTSLWTYQVGLKGESKELYAIEEQENAEWAVLKLDTLPTTFIWYKNYFDAPEGNGTVSLDLGSMSKGQAWVNGLGIGRFWSLVAPKDGCSKTCDYRGTYNENKCTTNCGEPTQTRYHIPREWLQPSNNLLVLFDEEGGNPSEIILKTHSTKIICARVSETHYPPLSAWSHANGSIYINKSAPEVHLRCDNGQKISSITFASYGNPSGSCQKYSVGKCHAQHSLTVVSEACQGKNSCVVSVSKEKFGQDPCRGIVKALAVQGECISDSDINYAISSV